MSKESPSRAKESASTSGNANKTGSNDLIDRQDKETEIHASRENSESDISVKFSKINEEAKRSNAGDTRDFHVQITVSPVRKASPKKSKDRALQIVSDMSTLKQKLTEYNKPDGEEEGSWIKRNISFKQKRLKLSEKEAANSFYIDLVTNNKIEEVRMLFAYDEQTPTELFDKNCVSEELKSALTIAAENHNENMMVTLLNYEVDIRDTIFYAIDFDFTPGVEQILIRDTCIGAIIDDDHHFEKGTTPMLLAARKNNYKVLELLHEECGHALLGYDDLEEDKSYEMWESLRKRRATAQARAEPAYILIHVKSSTSQVNDPFSYCLREIETLENTSYRERVPPCDFYKNIQKKLEDFMCSLLNNIKCPEEITDLFQEEAECPLLKQAVHLNLTRFVTHHYSQDALKQLSFSSDCQSKKKGFLLGFLYPILFLLHCAFSNSRLGKLMAVPVVAMCSWGISNCMLAVLLFAKRFVLWNASGQPFHPLEVIIALWTLAFIRQEIREYRMNPRAYWKDIWNWCDVLLALCLLANILIRIYDCYANANNHTPRNEWGDYNVMLVAKALDSISVLFVGTNLTRWLKLNRYLGPLLIVLEKISGKFMKFILQFLIIVIAFAICLQEIYLYYESDECKDRDIDRPACSNKTIWTSFFSTLSMINYGQFGLLDEDDLLVNGDWATYTTDFGKCIFWIYIFIGNIIMFNILIAIVNNAYNEVEANVDVEWKFNRSKTWIRFVGKNAPWPLPINLVACRRLQKAAFQASNIQRKVLENLVLRYRLYSVQGRSEGNSVPVREFATSSTTLTSSRKFKETSIGKNANLAYEDQRSIDEMFETDIGTTLLHAIDCNFMAGVEMILARDSCVDMKLEGDHYFEDGITPMLLAALNNNYRALSLLHNKHGHRLINYPEADETGRVVLNVKDSKDREIMRKRHLICRARTQSAYITIHVESEIAENRESNPIDYCLNEIENLRQFRKRKMISQKFCKELEHKLEDYMCLLLDNATSSCELKELFDFTYPENSNFKWRMLTEYKERCYILLNKARKKDLVQFLTHHHAQEALICLRYAPLPERWYWAIVPGVLFPIFSLFQLFRPKSALGGIITVPAVALSTWALSNLVFAVLLFGKKLVDTDQLGQPIHPLEWLIFVWALSNWVQEFTEMRQYRMKYIRDIWNIFDLLLLGAVTASFGIRIYDRKQNFNNPIPRYEWDDRELLLLAKVLDAFSYIFLIVRTIRLFTMHETWTTFGPLIISMIKIVQSAGAVGVHSLIMIFMFSLAMYDLYSYYAGEGIPFVCGDKDYYCLRNRFAYFPVGPLAWALFGMFDTEELGLDGKHEFIVLIGELIMSIYLIVSNIVIINILIAIVSNNYCKIEANEDAVWKFHRASEWLRFTGESAPRPLPINLIPKMGTIRKMCHWISGKCNSAQESSVKKDDVKYAEVSRTLMIRYKLKSLINSKKAAIESTRSRLASMRGSANARRF